jgi:excinuclease ABC subunit C
VGPARRKELINRFGSIEGILAASVEEISQIKGVSKEMAQAIKAQLE